MSITQAHTGPHGLRTVLARLHAAAADAFARAERAHHHRLGFAFISPEVLRDIRLSAEEATGLRNHQPDLPFFMQTGFQKANADRD